MNKVIKKTKIVSTLGPSTDSEKILEAMLQNGVNVFRINFSHAKHDDVKQKIATIRALGKKLDMNVGILADLQGPKLRVGKMKPDVIVNKNDKVTFVTGKPFEGDADRVFMNYDNFPKDVKPKERILLDDGKLIFEVVETNQKDEVVSKVIQGGPLRSRKGVNLPNTNISLPAMTEKDIVDAQFAIAQEVDWIALSFVRTGKDLKVLRDIIKKHSDQKIPIIAKIEKPEGVKNIDKIVAYCDGLMVARGDLGVEVPAHEVPLIQKQLVNRAKLARIPVIIATQMMESMIESLTPTRAEVNDVANSVMDGADAVMLSGETSIGKYPVEVIKKMSQIVLNVENSELIRVPEEHPTIMTKRFITKSICFHAAQSANEIDAAAICALTNSGYTPFQISAWRPNSNILAFSSNHRILNQLSLLWGVRAFYYDKFLSTDETIADVNAIARAKGYVKKGDFVINLAAMPVEKKGMVNTFRISNVD